MPDRQHERTEQRGLSWVQSVPKRLRDGEKLALRVDRDGYVAFIQADGVGFELTHRHYHEDEWRTESLSYGAVLGSAARFSSTAEIVTMPDVDTVEVVCRAE